MRISHCQPPRRFPIFRHIAKRYARHQSDARSFRPLVSFSASVSRATIPVSGPIVGSGSRIFPFVRLRMDEERSPAIESPRAESPRPNSHVPSPALRRTPARRAETPPRTSRTTDPLPRSPPELQEDESRPRRPSPARRIVALRTRWCKFDVPAPPLKTAFAPGASKSPPRNLVKELPQLGVGISDASSSSVLRRSPATASSSS